MNYTVYVLYSNQFDKYYVGYSQDLEIRMIYHSETGDGWSKKYRPWQVIYSEKYESKKDAMIREKQLKSYQGRLFIRSINKSGK